MANAPVVHLRREHSSLGERVRRTVAREPGGPGGGLSSPTLKRATDYANGNLASGPDLGELPRAAGLSPYRFARLFGRERGSPLQA